LKKDDLRLRNWSFHQIKLADKTFYAKYIRKTAWPVNLWSANFPFIWAYSRSPQRKVLWKIIDGLLVTFVLTQNKRLFLLCLPFGSGDVDRLVGVLAKALAFCTDWSGHKAKIRAINSSQLEFLQTSTRFKKLCKIKKTKGIERHNSLPLLVALAGKNFSSIRRTVNKFYRDYPDLRFRNYRPTDYHKVLAFNNHWENTAGKKYSALIDKVYLQEIISHYQQLDMRVLVAELAGEIVGVNIGGILPTGESWGCICKTNLTIEGLHEAIILKFVAELYAVDNSIQYMNIGSDLGIKGLRQFKEKFRPVLNLARYQVFLK
jgi:hypothetical protein